MIGRMKFSNQAHSASSSPISSRAQELSGIAKTHYLAGGNLDQCHQQGSFSIHLDPRPWYCLLAVVPSFPN